MAVEVEPYLFSTENNNIVTLDAMQLCTSNQAFYYVFASCVSEGTFSHSGSNEEFPTNLAHIMPCLSKQCRSRSVGF